MWRRRRARPRARDLLAHFISSTHQREHFSSDMLFGVSLSTFQSVMSVTKTAQVELNCGRV